ncbi:hypothetical protein Ccrd_001203 [Cynara cardunculus var. scolymus]|uniref:Uncharacterized protein n=1 Tax=Cynara cardunculus var. scolymus TaxID=59895 RepID=A0A103XTP2_CYNCS|nr:hypothetical protein Ccrd_001203 [Cynara cardunculus var. scolymus]
MILFLISSLSLLTINATSSPSHHQNPDSIIHEVNANINNSSRRNLGYLSSGTGNPIDDIWRSFLTRFDPSLGQVMPQFWQIVSTIDRLTANLESLFTIHELLTAYSVKTKINNCYILFGHARGARTLVQEIDLSVVQPLADSISKVERFLAIKDHKFYPRASLLVDEEDDDGRRRGERERKDDRKVCREGADYSLQEGEALFLTQKGRDLKRKVLADGSGAKRSKVDPAKEPSSKTDDPPVVVGSEKMIMRPGMVEAMLVSSTPSLKSPLVKDKGTSLQVEKDSDFLTMRIRLSSDFKKDDTFDRKKLFPSLNQFLTLSFMICTRLSWSMTWRATSMARFHGKLFFLCHFVSLMIVRFELVAFQAYLCLYPQIDKVKKVVQRALAREREALAKEQVTADKCDELSVRLNDALNHLEEEGHAKEDMRQALDKASMSETELAATKATLAVN